MLPTPMLLGMAENTTPASKCLVFGEKPSGQYVAKKNRTLPILDGKEWERTGKPLISLGGCNFRKGKYLAFCRESNSQCGGQGFEPPLLHQKVHNKLSRLEFADSDSSISS